MVRAGKEEEGGVVGWQEMPHFPGGVMAEVEVLPKCAEQRRVFLRFAVAHQRNTRSNWLSE